MRLPKIIFIGLITLFGLTTALLVAITYKNNKSISDLTHKTEKLTNNQTDFENFSRNFDKELYRDQLQFQQKMALEAKLAEMEVLLKAQPTTESSQAKAISNILALVEAYRNKTARNESAKLKVENQQKNLEEWSKQLFALKYTELESAITAENLKLDEDHKKYLASLPPPAPSGQGYSYTTIKTEKGTHGVHLIKVPLSSVKVKTVSASSGDCKSNCPTKSLAEYVRENGGYAGMHGTYFCPPDYKECSGKVNSFDYALYDSQDRKWINKGALSWFKTGLMTFNGTSAQFYKKSSDYGGGGVSAGISNYPSLLKGGEIVVNDGDLTSFQKVKSSRGAIGVGGSNLYLAIIYNATMEEAAYAMRTLGAKDALNLDAGGSSAMYINGGYAVGPGRSLPNAIVLTK
jgi:hypothetical protein